MPRQLTWIAQAGDCLRLSTVGMPATWSTDGRFLAHLHGELVIRDGLTGKPLATFPEHLGASTLHWGQRGVLARLAVAIRDGNDAGARPAVIIYDGGEHRYQLDITLPRWEATDAPAWCWAPDGDRAAALTTTGTVEVYSLADTPELLQTLDVPGGTGGLLWGADDVLIAVGVTTLRFVAVQTGEVLGEFTFPSDEFEEDDLSDENAPESWLGIEDDQLVDRIEDHDDPRSLDSTLTWTVDRRFAWPLRWT
ncbi:hypothetical protein [Saccharopolyspora sp. NPDC002376]